MTQDSDSGKMLRQSLDSFRDDGVLDLEELEEIINIALADGVMDAAERAVLKNVIYNLTSRDLTPEMWERVEELIELYNLDEVR